VELTEGVLGFGLGPGGQDDPLGISVELVGDPQPPAEPVADQVLAAVLIDLEGQP